MYYIWHTDIEREMHIDSQRQTETDTTKKGRQRERERESAVHTSVPTTRP